jgi:uncharacterized membrane protein
MNKTNRNLIITFFIVILIGAGLAFAGSQGGGTFNGIPVFALAVGLAFLINWVAFIPAYLLQSEKFYDLTGGITYTSVIILAVALSPVVDGRSILLVLVQSRNVTQFRKVEMSPLRREPRK